MAKNISLPYKESESKESIAITVQSGHLCWLQPMHLLHQRENPTSIPYTPRRIMNANQDKCMQLCAVMPEHTSDIAREKFASVKIWKNQTS